jgi:hypothetical protein
VGGGGGAGGGGAGGVAAELSLNYPKYSPHVPSERERVIFDKAQRDGGSAVGGAQGGNTLLTAAEKIDELTRVAAVHAGETGRLETELAELRAEKVSMEYLLREKLERLVQSEIEARLRGHQPAASAVATASASAGGDAERQLRQELDAQAAELQKVRLAHTVAAEQLATLRMQGQAGGGGGGGGKVDSARVMAGQLREARAEREALRKTAAADRDRIARQDAALRKAELGLARAQAAGGGGGGAGDAVALRSRCSTLEKERRAVQTIMEDKVKTLVEAISRAATAAETGGGARAGGEGAQAGAWLKREIAALQRLVNASIAALRNADAAPAEAAAAAPAAVKPMGQQSRTAGQQRAARPPSAALRPAQQQQQQQQQQQRQQQQEQQQQQQSWQQQSWRGLQHQQQELQQKQQKLQQQQQPPPPQQPQQPQQPYAYGTSAGYSSAYAPRPAQPPSLSAGHSVPQGGTGRFSVQAMIQQRQAELQGGHR